VIHHVSIPARNPRHVAEVLAELFVGRAYPFAGRLPGAFMAVSGDPHGTMVEVYPESIVLEPGTGEGEAIFADGSKAGSPAPGPSWPFHALISVPRERVEIERIGEREGWRTKFLGRGAPGQPPAFHVIEFWIENRLMLEVVTKPMAAAYAGILQFEPLDRFFAARAAARAP
jgi:hypothetical protein